MGSRRRCCCSAAPVAFCCFPCKIPPKDLSFTQEFWLAGFPSTLLYSSTITLTYATTGVNPWDQSWTGSMLCPDSVSRAVTMSCVLAAPPDPLLGTFIRLFFPLNDAPYTVGDGGRPRFHDFTEADGSTESSTCTPFISTLNLWDPVDGNYRGKTVVFDPAPDTTWDCCYDRVTITGCNGEGVPGATYGVWVDSSKATLIYSGTANSLGAVTGDNIYCATSRYREIAGPRLTSVAGTRTLGVGIFDDALGSPIAGYRCAGECGVPVAETLHSTHPVFGPITYTWDSGSSHWLASVSYGYPGNVAGGGACTAKTVTIACEWDGLFTYTESWNYDGSDCPDDAGANTASATWDFPAITCPPSFSFVTAYGPSSGPEQNLYGTDGMSLVITE